MKKILIIVIVCLLGIFLFSCNTKEVKAESLSDTINEQISNIDLSELEDFFSNVDSGNSFLDNVFNLLNGEYDLNFNSIFEYVLKIIFTNAENIAPVFITVFAIAVFCGLINSVKGSFFSSEIADVIFFVSFLSIILLFSTQLVSLYLDTRAVIENIGRLNEILSPILLTLMVASGGNVSAGIYKPAVALLSGTIIHIVLYFILPIVVLNIIFLILSNFSESVKLKKFSDLFSSIIKWVIGLSVTIFGLFMTVQGIAGASFDGISMKAAKYAISNSIPIIGGFLKDGFDLVVAGSILIKNSIGVSVVVSLFYMLLSPILQILAFSLMLKLTSALIEPVTDGRLADFCTAVSKGVTYLLVCILFVAFMFFIMVILMIFSANSFV